MTAQNTPAAQRRQRPAPPSSLDQPGWSSQTPAASSRRPRPLPRAELNLVDEGKPRIIQENFREDLDAPRPPRLYVIAEIAIAAVIVVAAILLVVGAWWAIRG